MLKLIFKNLYSRRKTNFPLLLELIIIGIVAWALSDTVIVNHYVRNMPLGYDMERYVVLHLECTETDETGMLTPEIFERNEQTLHRFANAATAIPEVEQAEQISGNLLETNSFSITTMRNDTLHTYSFFGNHLDPGWNTFSILGLKPVGKTPPLEEFTNMTFGDNDIILSESGARLLFGDTDPVGHYIGENLDKFDPAQNRRVIGVVSDIRPRSDESDAVCFYQQSDWVMQMWNTQPYMLIRLREGESARKFVTSRRDFVEDQFRNSGMEILNFYPLEEQSAKYLYINGYTNNMRLRYALMVFFLVNLVLGISGVFMLQTRKRSEEAGIMLSFGATPGRIRRILIGEGILLSTISCLIAFAIYYLIADTVGLANGLGKINIASRVGVEWISSFPTHFAIISLAVYLLITAAVAAGILIPATRISRVNPVDALRNE